MKGERFGEAYVGNDRGVALNLCCLTQNSFNRTVVVIIFYFLVDVVGEWDTLIAIGSKPSRFTEKLT